MGSKIRASSIKLKRAYEPPAASDGQRILIDRLWPRGVSKAKAAIDTFLVRFGDLLSTGLVALGASLGLSVFGFALANVAFAAPAPEQ